MNSSSLERGHRSFLLHKPINVVSSTVDSHTSDVIRTKKKKKSNNNNNNNNNSHNQSDDDEIQLVGGTPRLTAYDMARIAGFPTEL